MSRRLPGVQVQHLRLGDQLEVRGRVWPPVTRLVEDDRHFSDGRIRTAVFVTDDEHYTVLRNGKFQPRVRAIEYGPIVLEPTDTFTVHREEAHA